MAHNTLDADPSSPSLPEAHGLLWGSNLELCGHALRDLVRTLACQYRIAGTNTLPGSSDPFSEEDYERPGVIGSCRGSGWAWIARKSVAMPPQAAVHEELPPNADSCACLSGNPAIFELRGRTP